MVEKTGNKNMLGAPPVSVLAGTRPQAFVVHPWCVLPWVWLLAPWFAQHAFLLCGESCCNVLKMQECQSKNWWWFFKCSNSTLGDIQNLSALRDHKGCQLSHSETIYAEKVKQAWSVYPTKCVSLVHEVLMVCTESLRSFDSLKCSLGFKKHLEYQALFTLWTGWICRWPETATPCFLLAGMPVLKPGGVALLSTLSSFQIGNY